MVTETSREHRVELATRRLLQEIEVLESRDDLGPDEIARRKRDLAGLILDRPEVSSLVREAFDRLERKLGLSLEVREHIIERLEDALLKFPEAATSRHRLRGLIRTVTKWGVSEFARIGRTREGGYILEHPRNACSLDEPLPISDGEGITRFDVIESPASVDILETLLQHERLARILDLAEREGEAIHQTVLFLILGCSHREIAAMEGISENAVAKRLERFRKILVRHGV